MKKLILVVALLIIGALALPFLDSGSSLTDSEFNTVAAYSCDAGKTFIAEFGDGVARVTLENDDVFTLESAETTVDAVFTNEGDQVVLTTKENSATLSEEGITTHTNCVYPPPQKVTTKEGSEWRTRYSGEDVGIAFEYREHKEGYFLTEIRSTEPDPTFAVAFILIGKSEYQEVLASTEPREGPPAITIFVFKNTKQQTPAAWASAEKATSNIELARGDIREYSLSGAGAIRFEADGLYLSDNVIAAKGEYIYVISGTYLEEDSQIRQDFEPFLKSIAFSTP
jgi:hypothetical protein